jgi:hypothetical protein
MVPPVVIGVPVMLNMAGVELSVKLTEVTVPEAPDVLLNLVQSVELRAPVDEPLAIPMVMTLVGVIARPFAGVPIVTFGGGVSARASKPSNATETSNIFLNINLTPAGPIQALRWLVWQ